MWDEQKILHWAKTMCMSMVSWKCSATVRNHEKKGQNVYVQICTHNGLFVGPCTNIKWWDEGCKWCKINGKMKGAKEDRKSCDWREKGQRDDEEARAHWYDESRREDECIEVQKIRVVKHVWEGGSTKVGDVRAKCVGGKVRERADEK